MLFVNVNVKHFTYLSLLDNSPKTGNKVSVTGNTLEICNEWEGNFKK